MTIGTNLRHLREERGLTQEQVADKMDVTFQAVSAWERDEYKPDIGREPTECRGFSRVYSKFLPCCICAFCRLRRGVTPLVKKE